MDKTIENNYIMSGGTYTTPGETEKARRELYCSQRDVDFCCNCSLNNYGRDCKNNEIEDNINADTRRISTR